VLFVEISLISEEISLGTRLLIFKNGILLVYYVTSFKWNLFELAIYYRLGRGIPQEYSLKTNYKKCIRIFYFIKEQR